MKEILGGGGVSHSGIDDLEEHLSGCEGCKHTSDFFLLDSITERKDFVVFFAEPWATEIEFLIACALKQNPSGIKIKSGQPHCTSHILCSCLDEDQNKFIGIFFFFFNEEQTHHTL